MTEEVRQFIELLRQLSFEQLKEFYCMIQGAALVAEKSGDIGMINGRTR